MVLWYNVCRILQNSNKNNLLYQNIAIAFSQNAGCSTVKFYFTVSNKMKYFLKRYSNFNVSNEKIISGKTMFVIVCKMKDTLLMKYKSI